MKRIKILLIVVAVSLLGLTAALAWWAQQPLDLPERGVVLPVAAGTSLNGLASQLAARKLIPAALPFRILGRIKGSAARIRAGAYVLRAPLSPWQLLDKVERGEVMQFSVQFIEGWNLAQLRRALAAAPYLRQDTAGLDEAALRDLLGISAPRLEGQFFPDTYFYQPGSSDLAVLRQAYQTQARILQKSWDARQPDLPYQTPYEALIMASIVEKETAQVAERPLIAAVFLNRLRLGMRLQTDPTVIYGLGARYDGNLRKVDLQTDTPYNTYTRSGLPPTPIALVSEAAIRAALHPEPSSALYFVARGDGSHVFSDSLEAHNRAVNQYQRRR
jgi:UPF0755 protein